MSQPVPLEVVDGEMLLNGHPLEQDEIDQIMHNLRSGAASLRYRQSPFRAVAVQKMEAHLEQMDPLGVVPGEDEVLAKGIADKIKGVFQKVIQRNQPQETSDLAPEEAALEHFKKLAKDPASQAHYDALRRAMFEDSMIPGMGNKRAFTNFQAREQKKNSGGIHIMMDGNDFKRINDDISHEAGDQAIGLMGRAVQDAIHESVGHENAKSHRFGGDEFHVHVPTMEHATQFTRKLREKLEAIPAVNGTHKLSMSVGLGNSYEDADAALNHPTEPSAKTVKGTDKTKVVGEDGSGLSKWLGADKMYVHSRVKGFEGPVPMHEPNPMASMKAAGLKMPSAAKLPSPAPAKAPGVAPMQTTTVGSTPDPTPAPRSPGVAPIKA
jgi:diguanylate cyclase (GGDEF)-like protein